MRIAVSATLLAAGLLAGAVPAAAPNLDAAHATYAKLLETYVTSRGVRYRTWRANGDDLKAISTVVASCRGIDAKTLTPEQRKALLINLYNAKVLETVLQGNPKTSIKDLSRGLTGYEIFDRKMLLFQGRGTSLNEIETMLREEFKDPRIHFAINCGATSCPPIRPEVYLAASLDAQLDDATRLYLALPGAVAVKTSGGRATITTVKIFDWFAADFKASGGVLAFLAKHAPPDAAAAAATGKAKLAFAEYNWTLNSAP